MSIRVVVADDHAVLRAGLRMLLNQQDDIQVVAEADTAQAALEVTASEQPDVLVLDLAMPGGGSIEAIEQIASISPRTRVLVLSMYDDRSYLNAVIAAGGAGYVTKRAADNELLMAIRTVAAGRTYIDVSLSQHPPPMPPRPKHPSEPELSVLSDREREVLRMVALGHTNKEIAGRIHISVKSVESYRARVSEKLELHTRAELVRYALRAGLVRGDEDE